MIARFAVLLVLILSAVPAGAQDYAREKRWADEVTPGIVVGDAVWLEMPGGRKYLAIHAPAANPRGAAIIVHGIGVHPDHGVIGELRTKLTDLGWTTLSIQMPVQAADAGAEAYHPALFPQAIERIEGAVGWLAAKGEKRIGLVSHSMGSWMANAYFDATAKSPVGAWACLGLGREFSAATQRGSTPILDVLGENDLAGVRGSASRRRETLAAAPPGSRQVMIAAADHFYAGREGELARAIASWLGEVLR